MSLPQYYIPDIEDIFKGYECQVRKNIRMGIMERLNSEAPRFANDFTDVTVGYRYGIDDDKNPIEAMWLDENMSHPQLNELEFYLKYGMLRTPYLTREQLEDCGFRTKPDGGGRIILLDLVDSDSIMGLYITSDSRLVLSSGGSRVFEGVCKSINELRRICKYTGAELRTKPTTQST